MDFSLGGTATASEQQAPRRHQPSFNLKLLVSVSSFLSFLHSPPHNMIFRPATPGFLVTLTATILLALVSFNVPFNSNLPGPDKDDVLYSSMGAFQKWTHPDDVVALSEVEGI